MSTTYYRRQIIRLTCPKCGVEFNIQRSTIEKRQAKGDTDELHFCRDCKPYAPRKGKMTGHEVWEAYKKDKGIK